MNYLSHHRVALSVAPAASDAFFVGNLLPDLLSMSGDGRLRTRHVENPAVESQLTQGIRLHLTTDRLFHGHPRFVALMAEASTLLRGAPLSEPPHRVFFLAHVAVEIALDAQVLIDHPTIVDHLYETLRRCDRSALAMATQSLLGTPDPPANLSPTLDRFIAAGYLRRYAFREGQVEALDRLSRIVGLSGFAKGEDRRALAIFFERLAPAVDSAKAELTTSSGNAFTEFDGLPRLPLW